MFISEVEGEEALPCRITRGTEEGGKKEIAANN